MTQVLQSTPENFIDRRSQQEGAPESAGHERRQFTNSHTELSGDAQELANAIDEYKMVHRRRFITYEEMLGVVKTLGYHK